MSIKQVDEWADLIEHAGELIPVVLKSVGQEVIGLIKDGFRKEKDPYGRLWKRPKARPDGRKILSGKTSRLKGGWHVSKETRTTLTISPSVDYASHHQAPRRGKTGKLKRPRRMMVPIESKGLPRKWARDINSTIDEALTSYFSPGAATVSGVRKLRSRIGISRIGSRR